MWPAWQDDDVFEKFLDNGHDPNLIMASSLCMGTINPPLRSALDEERTEVARLLLKRGAYPNLTNDEGDTALHIICSKEFDKDLVSMLFELSDEGNQTVQIDAQNDWGTTPLQLALRCGHKNWAKFLLRRGANPRLVNKEGLGPLHAICMRNDDDDLVEIFFNINDEIQQTIPVDARDKTGRTPLQLAVANLLPHVVDVLLDHGADLSSFVFPTESDFYEKFKWLSYGTDSKLRKCSCIFIVIEYLEKRGYELHRSDALTIMKIFAKHKSFEKSDDLEEFWYRDPEFALKAKELVIKPNCSIYDVIQLRPDEAPKLFAYTDYYKFACSKKLWELPYEYRNACAVRLCEMTLRRFCQRWALDSFMELTHCQLPILCCDMIIKQLMNEDLVRICLGLQAKACDSA
uniref:SOCS box domain-containing protein n=1 Tax=Trichogramma kaykai TaxID=54128 RepID=A0ABD2X384_9HYME